MVVLPWPEVADTNQEWERRGQEIETLMVGATQIFRHIQQNPTLLQNPQFPEQGQLSQTLCTVDSHISEL